MARRELAVPGKPTGVLVEDLTGDGHPELVAALTEPGRILLWRGGPDGLAVEPLEIPVGDYPLAPVSLPGPGGRRLLAVASQALRELTLFDPGGVLPREPQARFPLPEVPRVVAAGDLGADGVADVLVALAGGGLVQIASGAEPVHAQLGAERPTCLRVLDDGSGLVVGFQLERVLGVYPCLLYTSPSPRDQRGSRMPSSA